MELLCFCRTALPWRGVEVACCCVVGPTVLNIKTFSSLSDETKKQLIPTFNKVEHHCHCHHHHKADRSEIVRGHEGFIGNDSKDSLTPQGTMQPPPPVCASMGSPLRSVV